MKYQVSEFRIGLTLLIINLQVLPSDPFGGFKWPFQGLSDLHLGDQKYPDLQKQNAADSPQYSLKDVW